MPKYQLDSIQKQLWKELSVKHGLTMSQINDIFTLPFKFMKDTIQSQGHKLRSVFKPEDAEDIKTNFNLPYLAKMYLNVKHLVFLNNKFKDKEEENE